MNLYHEVYTRWRAKHTPDLIAVYDRNAYLMFTYDGDEAAAVTLDDLDDLDRRGDVLMTSVMAPCGEGRAWFSIRSGSSLFIESWKNDRWKASICSGFGCMDEETKALRRQFTEAEL